MSFKEFALARQYLAEERIGPAARAAAQQEDDAFARTSRALAALKT